MFAGAAAGHPERGRAGPGSVSSPYSMRALALTSREPRRAATPVRHPRRGPRRGGSGMSTRAGAHVGRPGRAGKTVGGTAQPEAPWRRRAAGSLSSYQARTASGRVRGSARCGCAGEWCRVIFWSTGRGQPWSFSSRMRVWRSYKVTVRADSPSTPCASQSSNASPMVYRRRGRSPLSTCLCSSRSLSRTPPWSGR